ncbi:GGDEF domain-containing protein [Pseudofulvimonas gallinarii]|uniref:diguanylate cyclase n=1 Tax=Pseudofulvimonas gallinarii TaxID=634155 RepID=A0A4R3LKN6_9GAMM|nr:GGDEF domain-containing protein [Pseudofulvimonas gallinarii]TCT00823.1 diguanylate cyclase (GGDEF)-like protein [Pseudofulvimonas gallinarii]
MIDLDHFKTINDVGGHPFGDAVLADLGRCLLQLVPEDGMIARLGGEEFLMLCPRLGREHALALADRIRFAVHGLSRHAGERFMPVTVSQGLAVFDGVDCHDQSSWMQRADHAVYRAKANGRDRVEVAVPTVRTAGDAVCT